MPTSIRSLRSLRHHRLMSSSFQPYFTPPPTSVYIHLPFCAQRCAYCAFPVVVTPNTPATIHPTHASYIDLLCREITAFKKRPSSPPEPLKTVYLGGGTPSLLDPTLLSTLLTTLRASLPISPTAEITCEMDPATFDFARASAYAHLGVNRASVGAQSFDDSLLSACRRIHNTADIYRAIHTLRKARIPNISLDLISGLPNQTSDAWRHSLRSAIDLHPDHIAAYDLTLEEGTPFAATFRPGLAPLPQEHTAAEMMQDAARILTHAGYEHYEISNFARVQSHAISPFRSRHNMAYWCNKPFYGFGLGATSLVDGFRFARPRRMRDYQRYVEDLERGLTQGGSSVWQSIYPHALPQTSRERQEDFFINSFRLLVEGVQIHLLESLFGTLARRRFEDAIRRCISFVDDGLLEILYNNKGDMACIRLTEKGALVENSILSSLIQEALWKFPEEEALAP